MNQWRHRLKGSLETGALIGAFFGVFAWGVTAVTPTVLSWVRVLDPGPLAVGGAVALITGIAAALRAWHMSW